MWRDSRVYGGECALALRHRKALLRCGCRNRRQDGAARLGSEPDRHGNHRQRFRIPSWQASVDGKQALVAQAYNLLKGEVDIRRSTLLEIVVIVLILLELVAAVRGK